MPTFKKKLIAAVDVGCSCRKLKLSSIFHPKPKRSRHYHHSSASTSSWNTTPTTTTTATFSPNNTSDTTTTTTTAVQGFGWLGGNSLAVEKDTNDPYVDFRDSMLQMIVEKEIYKKDDLRELLNCFLQLNSPYYHGIIVKAFTEIYNNLSN
ncbi:uncharacterized protein [Rutidosis leptorrhynchoides]|uniref:uncharacterized protein n=1 Tax=Rutidosis leptorrhynchoides TaxID=125765 RepID=UPI003A9A0215